MADYQGVDLDKPIIKNSIKNMLRDGEPKEKIARVIGVPHEIIEAVQREMKNRG